MISILTKSKNCPNVMKRKNSDIGLNKKVHDQGKILEKKGLYTQPFISPKPKGLHVLMQNKTVIH